MKQITKEWLNRAKDDIDVIESILDKKHLTNMVAFHSQQLVEKCFKAVIEEYEINFIKIHNLETLFGRIKQIKNFKIDLNVLKMLDEIYISARYPGELGLLPYGKPTFEDAFHFYTSAKDIFIEISNFLKTEE